MQNSKPQYNDSRPWINAGNDDLLDVITGKAWEALRNANDPATLFQFGDGLVRLDQDSSGEPRLKEITVAAMIHEAARCARWFRTNRRGEKVSARPAREIAVNLLATPNPPVPVLERVYRVPVFGKDGSIHVEPGYDARARGIYVPAKSLCELPEVSENPETWEIEEARSLIRDELLGDFLFEAPSDVAHTLAFFLLPFVRSLIDGPTPLHLFTKPSPGTGATLCAQACALPSLGIPPHFLSAPNDENEWSRTLLATLLSAPPFVIFDNLPETVRSSALANAITANVFAGRSMGESRLIQAPVRCIWAATGNNPSLSRELARRSLPIRLNARHEHPEQRTRFRHPNLLGWVRENHSALV